MTRSERGGGSTSLRVLILVPMLLLLAGLIVDGGRHTQATATAQQVANEAARAGSNAMAPSLLAGGSPDKAAGAVAAERYMAASQVSGSVSINGAGQMIVTTRVTRPTIFLSMVGLRTVSGEGAAVVTLVETGGRP